MEEDKQDKQFTPLDRIRELNSINDEYAGLLQHAGRALKALSHEAPSPEAIEKDRELNARKLAFDESTRAFLTTLQSANAKLKRQAYALEEAGIIAAEPPAGLGSAAQTRGGAVGGNARQPEQITGAGVGTLDMGWLNSRGNKVGTEKEAELMEEAKKLVEDVLERNAV
jgi:hypothetical protein